MNIIVAPSLYEQIKEYDRTPKSVKAAQARQVDNNGQPVPRKSYESKIGKPDYLFTQDDIPNLDLGVQRRTIQEICQESAKKRSKLLQRNFIADEYLAAENCSMHSPTGYSYENLLSEETRNALTLNGELSGYDAASKMFITGTSNGVLRKLLIYCFKDVWVGMYIDFLNNAFEPNVPLAKYVVMFKRPATKKKLLEKIQFTVEGIQYIKNDVDFSNFEFVTHSDGNEYVRYTFDLTRNSPELEAHAHLIGMIQEMPVRSEAYVYTNKLIKESSEYFTQHQYMLTALFSTQELGYSLFTHRLNLFGLKLFTPFIAEMNQSNYITKNYILDRLISIESYMSSALVYRYGFLTFAPSLKPSISAAFPAPCSQMLGDANEFDANKLIHRMGDMLKAEFVESILGTLAKDSCYPHSNWKDMSYEEAKAALYNERRTSHLCHEMVGIDKGASSWIMYYITKQVMNTMPVVDGTFEGSVNKTFELIDSFISKINTPALRTRLHKMFAPLFQLTEKELYVLAALNEKKNTNSFLMGKYELCGDFIYLFAKSGLKFHATWPDAPLDLYQKSLKDTEYPLIALLHDYIACTHPSIYRYTLPTRFDRCTKTRELYPGLNVVFNSRGYEVINEFIHKEKFLNNTRTRTEEDGIMPKFMQYIQDKINPATLLKWIEESIEEMFNEDIEHQVLNIFAGRSGMVRNSALTDAIQMTRHLGENHGTEGLVVSKNASCEKFHDAVMNYLLNNAKEDDTVNSILLPAVLIPSSVKVQHDAFQYRSVSSREEDHDNSCLTIKDAVWEVLQPCTMQYLKSWSHLVSNCVGTSSNYADDIRNKKAFIVLMKINGKPRITIQMNLKGQELNIVQIKDIYNGYLSTFKIEVVKKVLNKALKVVADRLVEA